MQSPLKVISPIKVPVILSSLPHFLLYIIYNADNNVTLRWKILVVCFVYYYYVICFRILEFKILKDEYHFAYQ